MIPSARHCSSTIAAALAFAFITGCGDDDAAAGGEAPTAASDPAPEPAPPPAMPGEEEVELEIDPEALPSGELSVEAFAQDACTLASAEQMDAFLGFVDGVTMERDEGVTGGATCVYRAEDPYTTVEVHWEHSMDESATETIAGKSGFEVDVDSSTLQSFARTKMRLDHGQSGFEILVVQMHVRDGVIATEDSLRAAIETLTGSLVERMGLAESEG